MGAHFTFLGQIISNPDVEKFVTGLIIGTGICLLGKCFYNKLKTESAIQENIVPKKKAGFIAIVDFCAEAFVKYHDSVLGKENRRHVPFCGSIFFLVLFSNLFGLIPGLAPATNVVWFNVGIAFVVFFYFNYVGIQNHGLWGYVKHFMGPSIFLAVLIFPIEIFSVCMRVFTLNLRLFWNIMADHLVLGIFTDMIKLLAVPLYALGTFVSFMQAFVFTTLTMVYILLASQHHEEDAH